MRRGLTLIEVLVAIALVLALVGGMYNFLYEMLETRAQAEVVARRQEAASLLIERIEMDLFGVVAAADGGSGLEGDATSIALLTRGVPVFAAAGSVSGALADLERAEYRHRGGALEARRSVAGDDVPPGRYEPLGAEVHDLRFRYHDGDDWTDTFDAQRAGRLPAAVEVSIWFEPWGLEPGDEFAEPLDDADPPPPDRRRVIIVPDAEGRIEDVDEEAGP